MTDIEETTREELCMITINIETKTQLLFINLVYFASWIGLMQCTLYLLDTHIL